MYNYSTILAIYTIAATLNKSRSREIRLTKSCEYGFYTNK